MNWSVTLRPLGYITSNDHPFNAASGAQCHSFTLVSSVVHLKSRAWDFMLKLLCRSVSPFIPSWWHLYFSRFWTGKVISITSLPCLRRDLTSLNVTGFHELCNNPESRLLLFIKWRFSPLPSHRYPALLSWNVINLRRKPIFWDVKFEVDWRWARRGDLLKCCRVDSPSHPIKCRVVLVFCLWSPKV